MYSEIENAELNGWDTEYYNEIDAEIVGSAKCPECGNIDLEYIGRKSKTGSYRAFSCCPICNQVDEF